VFGSTNQQISLRTTAKTSTQKRVLIKHIRTNEHNKTANRLIFRSQSAQMDLVLSRFMPAFEPI
jgi:hypothetical protein